MIDEKKLLADLEKEIQFAKKCNMPQMVAGMNQIKSIIENQPKVGEWIPCSERLPEETEKEGINGIYKLYLVTLDDETVCIGAYMQHEKGWLTRKFYGEKDFSTDNTVVSWMPLPLDFRGV